MLNSYPMRTHAVRRGLYHSFWSVWDLYRPRTLMHFRGHSPRKYMIHVQWPFFQGSLIYDIKLHLYTCAWYIKYITLWSVQGILANYDLLIAEWCPAFLRYLNEPCGPTVRKIQLYRWVDMLGTVSLGIFSCALYPALQCPMWMQICLSTSEQAQRMFP